MRSLFTLVILSVGLSILCRAQTKTAEKLEQSTQSHDYSGEAYVIEHLSDTVTVKEDSSYVREVAAKDKVILDAGVKELAVLRFSYTSANEVVNVEYVRVRKPDGMVVLTPNDNIQDMPADVTRTAPMYSDIREKHIAVKGLGPGDVLEYKVRFDIVKPEIPGQFWYEHSFEKRQIVRDERVTLSIPKGKHLTVKSPDFKPEIREDGARHVYTWNYSHLERTQEEDSSVPHRIPPPSIQVTTFPGWDEIGRWYGSLQNDQIALTPSIQAKAKELTNGLVSDDQKLRAIYTFVSVGIHYIALDFGIGRFKPHSANDVFENKYGDCKDKHTLLAALLKAAGYEAWPALISTSRTLDVAVPSPAQFDHVITVVPLGKKLVWLDTTPEVAPYELLLGTLRDKQALVIPNGKAPVLLATPASPPFPQEEHFTITAKLSSDGVLSGHVEQSFRGDSEVLMRILFRQTPQSNWKELVQRLSYNLGLGGDVSNVTATAVEDLVKPFEVSYDYLRKDFSDWEHRQITVPLPPFGIESAAKKNEKPPGEAVVVGGPAELLYESRLELPPGSTAFSPKDLDLVEPFAEYHSVNVLDKGTLKTARRLVLKKREVLVTDWEGYRKLAKSVFDDEFTYLRLLNSDDAVVNAVAGIEDARQHAASVGTSSQQNNRSQTTGEQAASEDSDAAGDVESSRISTRALRRTVQADLDAEKFDELDHMADRYRREKTRLHGGGWVLRTFYSDLNVKPQTDQQTIDHLAHLEHWMTQRPDSITARVALAQSLISWAWVARGGGFADKVTDEGWRLYNDRLAKAAAVLESATKISARCPDWYNQMLSVGQGQGWEAGRMKKILEQGLQLEPEYYYLESDYAWYLLPKWHGKKGDSSAFAKAAADKIGDDDGDLLYYHLAVGLISRSNSDFDALEMDWGRIQRGYKVLVRKYRGNLATKNELAYLACRFKDAAVARQQFALIGEEWSGDVWGDRKVFDRARDWAKAH